jgi:RNA polymerase-associated protein LEO1
VKQTDTIEDDAIERLQAALATAANATKVAGATGHLEVTDVDPEEQRRLAEQAERQAMRDRKKRENAQERERMRTDRALGRAGLSSARYGGLNVGMLEDDEGEGGRGRAQAGKPRGKPRRRRNSEYSEDEDFGHKRFSKEDSYDQEDDFVAPSDEEEAVDDDEDPDDGIIEEAREKTPKRDRPVERTVDDEDAEGEVDDDLPQARTKRRRVVDDEDEDE